MADAEDGAASGAGSSSTVDLSGEEEQNVRELSPPRAAVVFETIRREGEGELARPASSLFWSGLAAGMSMGFSLAGVGLIRAALPETPWRPLVENFGYTIGFLIVIMGRQQLFTENTLTVILPLFDNPDKRATFAKVVRLWSIVLVANLIGTAIFAFAVARLDVFAPAVQHAFDAIALQTAQGSFGSNFVRAIFAGWLIALMVWLLPAAENARSTIVIIITYVVGLAGFAHIIAGSAEELYAVARGIVDMPQYLVGFLIPVFSGNALGGVTLVALLNYAQVANEGPKGSDRRV